MPNKLTDAEIKKALEEYVSYLGKDRYIYYSTVKAEVLTSALDLINRQEEKIAEKERIIGLAEKAVVSMKKQIEKLVAEKHIAKAEAYKECIEKVKEKSCKISMRHNDIVVKTDYQIPDESLDNLLNELVGGSDGKNN